ncbi:MAG: helix-turn-helix domain-containing protein, partial [Firmicutes bacterium]|nr:helix-turn-helix domain-containing protein [Bacillota bacterium]
MAKRKSYNNIDIVITGNVAWCDELSWTEKILYGIVRGLTRNDYYCCYASNEHLGERIGRDESAVRRYLRALEKLGFIRRADAYVEDDYGGIYYTRAIVPTDMLKKFEQKRDEMKDLKGSQKNTTKAGKITRPQAGKNTRLNINMLPYKEKYISITNNEVRDNPQTPLQGGNNAVASVKPEQFEILGEFQNVRLTQSQRAALRGEFGPDMLSALIEQLDAYI